jgi:sugar lactone lactonase YvrE
MLSRPGFVTCLSLLLASCDPTINIDPGGGGSPSTTTGSMGGSPNPLGGSPSMGGAPQMGGMGEGGEQNLGGFPVPPGCEEMVTAPAPYEQLFGFTSSEDFVFDELGNYVGIDGNGNLVRITYDGQITLWAPAIGSGFMAGMGILPDGSAIVCDAGAGSLKKVTPNGTISTLLGGLQYPNGMDIGADGYIYVAENGDDQVRRVDPNTGEFTIAGDGMIGPNGVTVSTDPKVLFVGSFGGGIVYKVQMGDDPTQPGTVTEFATGFQSGGLDGIGVDECGYVYVAEYTTGVIYRITPAGETSVLANVPSFWIPNIKWGRGLGGFERNVMYVADRDQASLFAMQINREGAVEFYDVP